VLKCHAMGDVQQYFDLFRKNIVWYSHERKYGGLGCV
jgi:hypothetical protein